MNATSQKTALIGFHDAETRHTERELLGILGFSVTEADSLDEMLARIGANGENPETFSLYMMDINLGTPAGPSCAAAERVYKIVQSQVVSGQARFLGLSGNIEAVRGAKEAGIPCINKIDTYEYRRFLDSL